MGSGGLVVLDDSDCMVDMARYFLQFTQAESCGKCSFCRVGTKVMLDILERICGGKAKPDDLASSRRATSAERSALPETSSVEAAIVAATHNARAMSSETPLSSAIRKERA